MTSRLRWAVWLGVPALLVVLGVLTLWLAARHEPRFYREALAVASTEQKPASDRLLRRIGSMSNDLRNGRAWQLVLGAEEINGWLAVDLPGNHPEALPKEVEAPRVAIYGDQLHVAFRAHWGSVSPVVSLVLEPYLVKPDVVAVRIHRVRAGGLPVPLGHVLEGLSNAIEQAGLKLEWRQANGDPVAVVSLVSHDTHYGQVHLEKFQIADGKILLSGTSNRSHRRK